MKDVVPVPGGRYRFEGDNSGEAFLNDHLIPAIHALQRGEKLTVVLNNETIYSEDFQRHGFGMLTFGFGYEETELRGLLEITGEAVLVDSIWGWILETETYAKADYENLDD
jgi:hypothetical protein